MNTNSVHLYTKSEQKEYNMLESIIRSKATRKVMGLLFSNPDKKFYIRQLERLSGEPVNAVQRELKSLEKSGILLSKEEGRVKYFWVNKKNPIYVELKRIILKTQSMGDSLRKLFKDISGIKIAFIYGSVAKDEENITSDIDLMIIGGMDSVKLHSEINRIEDRIKRTINYTFMSEKEFKSKKTDFIKRTLKGKKIFLIGDRNELQKFI